MSHSPSAKKSRRNDEAVEVIKLDEDLENNNNEESRVVFVYGVNSTVTEADFHDALSQYGSIEYVLCMGDKALVEFDTVRSAKECVMEAQLRPLFVAGSPVTIKFSKSEYIRRSGLESQCASNVLIVSVYNVVYPITIEVIHQIASVHGRVMRIAMLSHHGVQALIEFDSVAAAKNAKQIMNGADIYSGCCTLKVEFSRVERVNVTKNSEEQWDYTIDKPAISAWMASLTGAASSTSGGADVFFGRSLAVGGNYDRSDELNYFSNSLPVKRKLPSYALDGVGYSTNELEPVVLMVYGPVGVEFNCDKIFNLVCPYGDCLKVKFLSTSPETCMVEMKCEADARNVIKYLTGAVVYGKKLQFEMSYSKHLSVPPPNAGSGFMLPDGTPYYKCFTDARNWRFINAESQKKNRLAYPSPRLHFFNVPIFLTDRDIAEFIKRHSGHCPLRFLSVRRVGPICTGIAEFDSVSTAIEVLVTCNHVQMDVDGSSARPYVFKVAFSAI